jgi:hypothetical protein
MLAEDNGIALLISLVLVASFLVSSTIVVRDATPKATKWSLEKVRTYLEEMFDAYYGRFRVRGLGKKALKYSLSLAFLLWVDAFLLLALLPLGGFKVVVLVSLAALAVLLTMTVLGFNARGPSEPNFFKFGIFYEPSFALVSTFLIGKLPDLAGRGLSTLFGMAL